MSVIQPFHTVKGNVHYDAGATGAGCASESATIYPYQINSSTILVYG